ncbi:hypothetical protein CYMTET_26925 [Cymbomonas tetramitiformis]|uniref:NACHT domain-containing protein n=1 Tax=Cymbomonas tetramitiformis TaxID=36881 RepID=A0AAE0FQT3_9CHLO|nr:hypothetical protein CYMTET_26925 [Cymbomonas tetramitiformis]
MGCGRTTLRNDAEDVAGHFMDLEQDPAKHPEEVEDSPAKLPETAKLCNDAVDVAGDSPDFDPVEELLKVGENVGLPEVLCYASKANSARANAELASVHKAAEQVAWAALQAGRGAEPAAVPQDGIKKLVGVLFQALRQYAQNPALGARLVGALRCMQLLALPAVRHSEVAQKWAGEAQKWTGEAQDVRRLCARMPQPLNIPGSPALLELSLTRMEVTLSQLPGPGALHAVAATMKVAFGFGQLLFTGTGAGTAASGLKEGAEVLTSAARKALHKECSTELSLLDVLAAAAAAARRRCPPGSSVDMMRQCDQDVQGWLEKVQGRHFVCSPDGWWEPVPGRWEPKAAFASLLGDLAMEGAGGRDICDPVLLQRLCLGDTTGVGLAQLLRLGLSDTVSLDGEGRERATMLLLTEWVQRALLEEWSPGQWAKDGSAFLQAQLGLLAEEAHAQLVSAAASLKAEAERIAALDWSRPIDKLRREAQQRLAAIRQSVDATRAALRQLGGAAKALLTLLCRARTVLHMICAPGQSCDAVNRAALRRLSKPFGLELTPERLRAWLQREVRDRLRPLLEALPAHRGDRAHGEAGGSAAGDKEHAAEVAEEVLHALHAELEQSVLRVAAAEALVDAASNQKSAAESAPQVPGAAELSIELRAGMERVRAAAKALWQPALQEALAEAACSAEAAASGRANKGGSCAADVDAAAHASQGVRSLADKIEEELGRWRSKLEGHIPALLDLLGVKSTETPLASWPPPGHLLLEFTMYTEAAHSVVETTAKAACDLEAELARVDVALERAEAEMRARPGSRAGADATANTAKTEIADSLVREAGQLVAMILAAVAEVDSVGGEEKGEAPEVSAGLESCSADEQQGHRGAVGRSLWRALGALRWLTAVQLLGAGESRKEEVVEEAGEAARDVVKTARKGLENALLDVKVAAMEQLEKLASSVGEAGESVLGGVADTGIGKTCGALLAPMTGLLADAVRAGAARRAAKLWQVREVAAVVIFRVLGFLREKVRARVESQEAQSNGTWDHEGVERVQQELQACVMQSLAYEPVASVRAVLLRGEALAEELNLVHGATQPAKEKEAASPGEERCGAWAEIKGAVEVELAAGLAALEKARAEAEREAEPLKKQERLLACREALASLAGVSRNVQDIGSALQVTMAFLMGMDTKLDAVRASLDALQAEVRELREDVRRMVGRPVLEEIWEQMGRSAAGGRRLRECVYIPARGVHGGEDGKFEPDKNTNPPMDLLEKVRDEFLSKEEKSVLLLSGPAGSGKTTFVEQLVLFLEREYVKKRAGEGEEAGAEGAPVLLVKALLPTLQNPLTDLFAEALRRSMQLREAQIHELRELAQQGKCRLLFLLDAYDELQTKHQFKNLYMTNNLEQYRDQGAESAADAPDQGAVAPSWPKVIITTRTELLARHKEDYMHAFAPIETMGRHGRGTTEDPRELFLELRIAPFTDQVEPYINAKVALEVRRRFELRVGAIASLSKEDAGALREEAREVCGEVHSSLLSAACEAVMVPGSRGKKGAVPKLEPQHAGLVPEGCQVASVLAAVLKEPPQDLNTRLEEFCRQQFTQSDERRILLPDDYQKVLDAIPELRDLATTPFMVEIVTEILPEVQKRQTSDAAIKATLLLLLTEEATQVTWGCIQTWLRVPDRVGGDYPLLRRVQEALQNAGGVSGDHTSASLVERGCDALKELAALSATVTDALLGQHMLLAQPKLLEMARIEVQAMQRKSHLGHSAAPARGPRDEVHGEEVHNVTGKVVDSVNGEVDSVMGEELQNVTGEEVDSVTGEEVQNVMGEEVDSAVDELLTHVEEEEAKEEYMRSRAIPFVLRSALRRSQVRRHGIYEVFVQRHLEREGRKANLTGRFAPGTVLHEGMQYARQLALAMVTENVSKVAVGASSQLFHRASVWDKFLPREGGQGELLGMAQKAAPVRLDNAVLTFMHKTVQEHLCAAALRDVLRQILRGLTVPLEQLAEQLALESRQDPSAQEKARDSSGAVATNGDETGEPAAGAGMKATAARRVDAVAETSGVARGVTGKPSAVQSEDRGRAAARALRKANEQLASSEWAQMDLHAEGVLRDFLADSFLDDPEFVEEVCFLAAWAERRCAGGRKAGAGSLEAGMLLDNVRVLLGGALPKRAGGTLLHAAAADGSYFAVATILEMRKRGHAPRGLLEQQDDEGRTPLFCAAQRGHAQVAAALLAAGAQRDARSKLQPTVRLVATVPFTKIPQKLGRTYAIRAAQPAVDLERGLVSIGGKEFIYEHGIVGAPAAAPFEGSWRVAAEDVGRRHQRTLLHWAAWWGDAELARRVLEVSGDRDACMRATDVDGLNAVWHAADRGHAEVLRVLRETSLSLKGVSSAGMSSSTGADFNYVALEGRTPAHVAADGGFSEALRVLKGADADLSHADHAGRTPAHSAAGGGHVEALRMLQGAGCRCGPQPC